MSDKSIAAILELDKDDAEMLGFSCNRCVLEIQKLTKKKVI